MSLKKHQGITIYIYLGEKIRSDKSSFGQTRIESLSDRMSGKFFSSFAKPAGENICEAKVLNIIKG
jgi:hypothetical protein